jgi:hypothetical protein
MSIEADRYSIRISEILELRKKINEINSIELKNIDFIDDSGDKININNDIINDFIYTGLNNCDFICTGFYKIDN